MKCMMLIWVMILYMVPTLFCASASAKTTITALASTVNPKHLEKASCYARIVRYDPGQNTLTVELLVPEIFPGDDVLELEIGDSIYTGGEEVLIRTISESRAQE